MARKERGLFRMIWKNFASSLMPNIGRKKLIGQDYYGTKYYEEAVASYSSRKKPARSFEPVNKEDHEQELPGEWESWLRYRRKDPPTLEEIEKNYKLAMAKKENAAELNKLYSGSSSGEQSTRTTINSFPTYEDYKESDRNYKIKH